MMKFIKISYQAYLLKIICNIWRLSLAVVKYDFKLIVESYVIISILFYFIINYFYCSRISVFVEGVYPMRWLMLAYLFYICFR